MPMSVDRRELFLTRPLMDRRVYLLAVLAIIGLGVGAQFSSHVIPDTAWSLHVAERLLHGSRLYVDVIEVNPPLVIWLNLIPAWLGAVLGASEVTLYRLGVIALCLLSAWLCGRVLRLVLQDHDPTFRRLILLLVLFALLPASREDFGEREHLLLALALPYVLLAAARARLVPVPTVLGATAGLLAGVGIALKPYFVALWLAIEAWLFFGAQIRRPAERLEGVLVALVGACYLGAVVLLTPEYLTIVRLMAGPYYHYLSNSLLITGLLGDGAPIGLFALLGFVALRGTGRRRELWTVLALATAGFYASALLQQKGWRYHFYPSLATGLVLIGVMAWDGRGPPSSWARRIYSVAVATAALLVPAFIVVACVLQMADPHAPRYEADPDLDRLLPIVREHAAGKSVMVLSSNMASSFPLVPYSGARWALRFPSVWFLVAAYQDDLFRDEPLPYRRPEGRGPLERYMADAVVADFQDAKPELILVLRSAPDRKGWGARRLDYVRYFRMDERFDRLFRDYGYVAEVGQYHLYRRGAEMNSPASSPALGRGLPPGRSIAPGVEWQAIGTENIVQAVLFSLTFGLVYCHRRRASWQ